MQIPPLPAPRALPGAARRLTALALTAAFSALAADPARAQDGGRPPRNGYDADIDLVNPMWTPDIFPGIDVPVNERPGTIRAGFAGQYMLNPLVLYEVTNDAETEVGPVVANRTSMWLGLSADVTRAVTVRASLPMHLQFGSQVPRYAADGFAVGDTMIGVHAAFLRKPTAALGVRLDAFLPTSRRDFYAGERMPRLQPAVLFSATAGRFRWATDLGVNIRTRNVDTTEAWLLGTELVWNNGLRYQILADRLTAGLSIYGRFGFRDFFGAEETSGEALLTVGWRPLPILNVTLSGGRGFTKGYGSSDARVFVGIELRRQPKILDEELTTDVVDPNAGNGSTGAVFDVHDIDKIIAGTESDGLEDTWEEGELARVNTRSKRIEIRETIQFKVNSEELLPESLPVLDEVARLMNSDATIGSVVIEGHASADGDFDKNYILSVDRARAIWERLVKQGVHPSRLAIRGMGEVQPAEANANYDQLQASRRVVFYIVQQHDIIDLPSYKLDLLYPWNGEPYQATQPAIPPPPDSGIDRAKRQPVREEDKMEDVKFETTDEDEDAPMAPDEETP
jgi:outer membrane protein OmpA-like peptidoglycan-associated protein